MNPFSFVVEVSGRGKKLFEQLSGLTEEQAQELLAGGYFTALRDAMKAGDLPAASMFRNYLHNWRKMLVLAFPVWKTITTGNISRDKFVPAFKRHGVKASNRSAGMMKRDAFTVAQQEETVDLVNVSVAELGFDTVTRYDAICQRAKERGLELCPPETGPQLRIQYLDQPRGEVLVVAMEAIRDSGGDLDVFRVVRFDGGLWLGSYYGGPDSLWSPGHRFVFRAPAVATSFAKATAVKKAMAGRRKQPSDT